MTRLELQTRILRQLNDSPTSPIFWSAAEVQDMIQEGQEIMAEEVRALRKTAYVPKRDGTQLYTMQTFAPDVMAPYRLWDMDLSRRLEVITMAELDADRERWLEVTGDQPFWWYPAGWTWFGVYPATATGGGWFRMDYLAWPTALLDDMSEPEWPEPDHDGLVLYGVYLGLLQQWDIVRATDLLTQVVARWTDSRARDGIRRLQASLWQREGN